MLERLQQQRVKEMSHESFFFFWGEIGQQQARRVSIWELLESHTHTVANTRGGVSQQSASETDCVRIWVLRRANTLWCCWECWQIPCMFSGFVCKRHKSNSNNTFNHTLSDQMT